MFYPGEVERKVCPQIAEAERLRAARKALKGAESTDDMDRVHRRVLFEHGRALSQLAYDIQEAQDKLTRMTDEFAEKSAESKALLAALGVHIEE